MRHSENHHLKMVTAVGGRIKLAHSHRASDERLLVQTGSVAADSMNSSSQLRRILHVFPIFTARSWRLRSRYRTQMISTTAVPRLSWSQISTYAQCPAKWWLSRHRPPERTPSALKFGSAIHRSVETFYRARMKGGNTGMDEVLAAYLDAWKEPAEAPVFFNKDETPESLRAMAERMLGAFLEAVRPGEILGVEESFAVEPVEGILVTGIVDLVEVKDGRIWIVDAKTGKNSPSDAFDKEQIGLYRLGLEELGLIPEGMPVGLRYDVLRKLKSKSEFVSVEVEVTEKELADLRQKLRAIWRAMDAGIIYRSRSWACDCCQWSKACAEANLTQLVRRKEQYPNA